jgi:alpha-ketoglutarate-dependent taurine dioxygenase
VDGLSSSVRWRVFRGVLTHPVTAEAVEAFAEGFGELSRRDGGIGAWLVKPRKNAGTYSEIAGPACFHTDSQYHHHPERVFVLACDTPAVEGGDNLLIAREDALAVAFEALGSAGVDRLKQAVWRWSVPKVFQSDSVPDVSPPSAIFREDGTMRWRIDNIVCDNDADLKLAQAFERALEASPRSERVRLLSGDVLLCDNWHALHARTDFSDMNRVLYRARLV